MTRLSDEAEVLVAPRTKVADKAISCSIEGKLDHGYQSLTWISNLFGVENRPFGAFVDEVPGDSLGDSQDTMRPTAEVRFGVGLGPTDFFWHAPQKLIHEL